MTLGELSTMIQIWNRFHKTKCRNGNNANVERKAVGKAFREGKECLYNILIMEEMQSIAALGAGASTKCYDRQRHIVSRVENVKSVTDYISRIDEMLQRKQEHGMGD